MPAGNAALRKALQDSAQENAALKKALEDKDKYLLFAGTNT
jgi:hypothetical protein